MTTAHHRLAAWLGGGGTRATPTTSRPPLNRPGPPGAWYPPTPPGETTAAMAAVAAAAPVVSLEIAHTEEWDWAQAQLVPLTAILAAWRSRMACWLDHEWLAWRELLHTYPAPEETR